MDLLASTALPADKVFITYSQFLLHTACIKWHTQEGEEGNIFMVGQRESSLELLCGFTCKTPLPQLHPSSLSWHKQPWILQVISLFFPPKLWGFILVVVKFSLHAFKYTWFWNQTIIICNHPGRLSTWGVPCGLWYGWWGETSLQSGNGFFFFFFFLVLLLRGECSAMSLSILLLLLVFSAHLRPRPLCFVLVSVWFVLFFSFTFSINTIFVTISPPSHTHLTIPAITEIAELLKSNYIFLMTSSPKNGN